MDSKGVWIGIVLVVVIAGVAYVFFGPGDGGDGTNGRGDETWPNVPCPPEPAPPQDTAEALLVQIRAKAEAEAPPSLKQVIIDKCDACLTEHATWPNHQPGAWNDVRQKVFDAWQAIQGSPVTEAQWQTCSNNLDHD